VSWRCELERRWPRELKGERSEELGGVGSGFGRRLELVEREEMREEGGQRRRTRRDRSDEEGGRKGGRKTNLLQGILLLRDRGRYERKLGRVDASTRPSIREETKTKEVSSVSRAQHSPSLRPFYDSPSTLPTHSLPISSALRILPPSP